MEETSEGGKTMKNEAALWLEPQAEGFRTDVMRLLAQLPELWTSSHCCYKLMEGSYKRVLPGFKVICWHDCGDTVSIVIRGSLHSGHQKCHLKA